MSVQENKVAHAVYCHILHCGRIQNGGYKHTQMNTFNRRNNTCKYFRMNIFRVCSFPCGNASPADLCFSRFVCLNRIVYLHRIKIEWKPSRKNKVMSTDDSYLTLLNLQHVEYTNP